MQGFYFIQDLAVILAVAGVVGWICKRLGLSVVVGFLVAGMVVGPFTPRLALVTNLDRIQTLAQIGLVFLMFSIGLRLSLRRLRRLGVPMLLAVFGSAVGVYYLTRVLGAAMAWNSNTSLFLAGMLMISSSAIVGKVLQETGTTHDASGQLAMGVTLLEGIVAVVMVTALNSFVQFGGVGAGGASLASELGMLGAFVVIAGVVGLLLVPWLLKRMTISADEELQTLAIGALLFGLAWIAQRAGFSLVVGAFLLGTIVAETAHRNQVERTFEGMRDIFSAVFFVAIGMQFNPAQLLEGAGLIVAVAVFTLLARPAACSAALMMIGTQPKDALRTGLMVTPIGEFSFIIAQLGVAAAVLPAEYFPLVVGVSLITTLVAPLLTRNSEVIAGALLARQPAWFSAWVRHYREWLDRMGARRRRNRLWQLSRKRFVQIGVEIILVSGVLVFSGQMLEAVEGWLGRDWLFPHGPQILFWCGLGLLLIAPLVAIWRNVSALSLLYSQVATSGMGRRAQLASALESLLKALAGGAMYLWLAAMLPTDGVARWLLLASAVVAVAAILLMRHRLIYWHSNLEAELQSVIASPAGAKMIAASATWLQPHEEWDLNMIECVLPDLADAQGKRIAELDLRARSGASIVGIERQGFMIPLPGPNAVLYPRDRVLLMGAPDQVQAGKAILTAVSGAPVSESLFEEVQMEALRVPEWSRAAGQTLDALAPARVFGVQIAGLKRDGQRMLNPAAEEGIRAGDELLALGAPEQIREFKIWLNTRPEDDDPADV